MTVNLAPAERRKEGASADLAMALGVLVATAQIPADRIANAAALGELALDGAVRGTRGMLALAEALWRGGLTTVLCPTDGAREAALIDGLTVHPVSSLLEAVAWMRGEALPRAEPSDLPASRVTFILTGASAEATKYTLFALYTN